MNGRLRLNYGAATPAVPTFQGFDPDTPVAGMYRHRLRSGGAYVAVKLWFGAPIEPWTGETMDRAPRWNATINGKWIEVDAVWPKCAANPIDEAEYQHLCRTHEWARQHMPDSPIADPTKRIDPLHSPLLF